MKAVLECSVVTVVGRSDERHAFCFVSYLTYAADDGRRLLEIPHSSGCITSSDGFRG